MYTGLDTQEMVNLLLLIVIVLVILLVISAFNAPKAKARDLDYVRDTAGQCIKWMQTSGVDLNELTYYFNHFERIGTTVYGELRVRVGTKEDAEMLRKIEHQLPKGVKLYIFEDWE